MGQCFRSTLAVSILNTSKNSGYSVRHLFDIQSNLQLPFVAASVSWIVVTNSHFLPTPYWQYCLCDGGSAGTEGNLQGSGHSLDLNTLVCVERLRTTSMNLKMAVIPVKIEGGNSWINQGSWYYMSLIRDHWGDPDVDGRIILRWIFRKWEGVVGTGWSWFRIGTGGGHLWVRWGTFGFQKCGEFLD